MVEQIDTRVYLEEIRQLVITGIMKGGIIPHINQVRWWNKDEMNSRIKAFDYLIRVYTDKVNKWVIKQD